MMQKLMINQAIEAMGLKTTQMFATLFDGITRHSPEGFNFKTRRRSRLEGSRAQPRPGRMGLDENRPINPGG